MRHPILVVPLLALAACTEGGGTSDNEPEGLQLHPVEHAGGRFVVAGSHRLGDGGAAGHIAASTDGGDTWTGVDLPDYLGIAAVTHGDGHWIAAGVGDIGRSRLLISEDAATWRPVTAGPDMAISGLAHGNGVFVAAPSNAPGLFVSADGETWNPVELGQLWQGPEIKFLGDRFVAYGLGSLIAESTDGVEWTVFDVGVTRVDTLVLHGDRILGSGFRGTFEEPQQVIIDGPDQWTAVERAGVPVWDFAIAGNALVGVNGDDVVRAAELGDTWTLEAVLHSRPWGITAEGATVVAVGDGVDVSHDGGVTWSRSWE